MRIRFFQPLFAVLVKARLIVIDKYGARKVHCIITPATKYDNAPSPFAGYTGLATT